MDFFLTVFMMMGRVLVNSLSSPLFIFLYFMLFVLVFLQNKRLQRVTEKIVGSRKNSYLRSTLVAAVFGILGGVLGSVLLIIMGVDLSGIAITQLWVVALLLMLIQQRFLCFAYAAGVLAVSSLLFGYPQLNIPQLMGLVAILHMVESFLILLNGSLSPLPVYVKKNGKMMGGFNLQLFWPIPLIALLSVAAMETAGGMPMPDWWPLLQGYAGHGGERIYTLLPVIALFSPLGHEMVIWLGMREEKNRSALYVHPDQGLMVLDVLPASPARQAGLLSGDVIVTMNDLAFERNRDFYAYMMMHDRMFVELLRDNRKRKVRISKEVAESAGIILAPDAASSRYLSLGDDTFFAMGRALWQRLKRS
ncbi:MAG: PDZ domain-containing protein [Bacillota bacterium]|nr:PDZ domain-containing protein [Bacillota bacterium]